MQTESSGDTTRFSNARLVGIANGLERLSTPALILDLDVFERNVAAAISLSRESGKQLRPHIKGQKSIAIGNKLVGAGAHGLSCTTLVEAELMSRTDARSLLITSPVVGDAMIERLVDLTDSTIEILAVADSVASVGALEKAFAAVDRTLKLVVDVDVGQRRTGVRDIEQLIAVALASAAASHLRFAGIQAYYGHLQAIADFDERKVKVRAAQSRINECIDELNRVGLSPTIVSGGGTGTCMIDARHGPFTELQLGSFALMDSLYASVRISDTDENPFQPALFVLGRVVSGQQPDRVTTNIGMKALSTDGGPGTLVAPKAVAAEFVNAGDEHGFLVGEGIREVLRMGDVVQIMPSHCDTTVNLHAAIHAVRGGRLEAVWPTGARGIW